MAPVSNDEKKLTPWRSFAQGVEVFSYPVQVLGHAAREGLSYEVHHQGELVQRFLFIDHGRVNQTMAEAWALGFATAMAHTQRAAGTLKAERKSGAEDDVCG